MEVAERLIRREYPDCLLAVLGGSAGRGEHNEFSDLDIVVVDDEVTDSYERKTIEAEGWVVELFFLNPSGYRAIFDEGVMAANPTLQRILAEGRIIVSTPAGMEVREEARMDLEYGPLPLTTYDLDAGRYMITEHMMDFKGARKWVEVWFAAQKLTTQLSEFLLRANNRWIGEGKTLFRMLAAFDAKTAADLEYALEMLYRHDRKEELLELATRLLEPYGGPYLVGYEE